MIPVKVRDTDAGDLARGDPGEQHLPLGSLPRIEQHPLAVPAQQVPVVVTAAGGRLTGRAKNHQLTTGHDTRPYAKRPAPPTRVAVSSPDAPGRPRSRRSARPCRRPPRRTG